MFRRREGKRFADHFADLAERQTKVALRGRIFLRPLSDLLRSLLASE